MALSLGDAVLWLRADQTGLDKDLGSAEGKTKSWAGRVGGALASLAGKAVIGGTVAAIGAITGAAVGGIKAFGDWAGQLDSIGDVLGTTADESAGLTVAIKTVGGNVDAITGQMAFLTRGLKDAKGEIGPTGEVLKGLGIAFTDANGEMLPATDILTAVADKLAAMPDGLEKTALMTDLFGKSGKDLTDVMNALANGGLDAATQKARDLGLAIGDDAVNASIEAGKNMETLKLAFQGLFVTIGSELMPVLTPMLQDLTNLAVGVMPGVRQAISDVMDVVGPFVEKVAGIATALLDAGPASIEFKEALSGLVGEETATAVIGFFQTLSDIWTNTLQPALVTFGDYWTNTLLPALQGFGATVAEHIAPFVAQLIAFFQDNLPPTIEMFKGVWEKSLKPALEKIGEIFSNLAAQVFPWFLEQIDKISAWFEENRPLIDEFSGVIRDVLGKALAAIGPIATALAQGISGAWNVIRPILEALLDAFLGVVKAIMQAATGDWAGAWKTIQETASKVWDKIKEAWNAFVDWVLGWFGTSWTKVKSGWDDFWAHFLDKPKETIEDIKEVGRDIVQGIEDGIAEKWDQFIAWVDEQIAKIPASVRKALGIASPSKVFYAIGIAIGAGLEEGLRESVAEAKALLMDQIRSLNKQIKEALNEGNKELARQLKEQRAQLREQLKGAILDDAEISAALLDMAGKLGGIGSGAVGVFQRKTLDPLAKKIEGTAAGLQTAKEELAAVMGWTNLTADDYDAGMIASLTARTDLTQEQARAVEQAYIWQQQLNRETIEYNKLQREITTLQEKQADLAYLQQQLSLIQLIKENGLDPKAVLGDLKLGVNADPMSLIQAMTTAMQALIDRGTSGDTWNFNVQTNSTTETVVSTASVAAAMARS